MNAFLESLERFFSDPRKTLSLSLAIGFAFAAVAAIFCVDSYRDVAGCYAYYAAIFGRGDFMEALQPALPPLPIAMPGILCYLGVPPLKAAESVSGLFYVLTAIPVYFMLKSFVERKHAAWGALLYILAPKIIRFGCSGLTEAYRNFFVAAALAFLLACVKEPRWWKAAAFGASIAGLAMARGEGIALSFALGLMLAFLAVKRELAQAQAPSQAILKASKPVLLALGFFALFMAPRGYQNYLACGYPVPDTRIGALIDKHVFGKQAAEPEAPKYQTAKIKTKPCDMSFGSQFNSNLRGAYEVYAALALLGAILLFWRREWRAEHCWLLAVILVNVAAFSRISISYRYYTVNVILLMPMTIAGFAWALSTLSRFKLPLWLIAAALAGLAIGQTVNGMDKFLSSKSRFEKETGAWLAANANLYPHSGKHGLPRIFSIYREASLWIPYESANPPLNFATPDFASYKDFDLAIVKTPANGGDADLLNAMAGRNDVEELKHPHSDKVAIFRLKKAAN